MGPLLGFESITAIHHSIIPLFQYSLIPSVLIAGPPVLNLGSWSCNGCRRGALFGGIAEWVRTERQLLASSAEKLEWVNLWELRSWSELGRLAAD